jgi:hypothetical protein
MKLRAISGRARRMTAFSASFLCALLVACTSSDGTAPAKGFEDAHRTLVIAPFLEGDYFCDDAANNPDVLTDDEAAALCAAEGETAADRVSAELDSLGPETSPSGNFRLGYTLEIPLLRYVRLTGGQFTVDENMLASNLQLINEVDRPVVVYISSDHFTDSNTSLASQLATNNENLMWTRDGPLAPEQYFGIPIIAWTLNDQTAPISMARRQAFAAAIDALCSLPASAQAKIIAVSVLGETHELFPNFATDQGFDVPLYEATDYSPVAVSGFQSWLAQKYGTIDALDFALGANFASFGTVNPPSKDSRTEAFAAYLDDIDPYAAGVVTIYGVIFDKLGRQLEVSVYLDGAPVGVAQMGLNRTDVTDTSTVIKDPNVGYRLKLDYRKFAYGIHTLEVLVSIAGQRPLQLAKQQLVILDQSLHAPTNIPYADTGAQPLSSDPNLIGSLDGPVPGQSLIYNPLAALWLEYRNQVVRDYIEQYAQLAANSCIPKTKIFSHQITPSLYGTYDPELFAADASNLPDASYSPGTDLYGGAAFGAAFVELKRQLRWTQYSVGEMHPQVPLAPEKYLQMFNMHRSNGAVFVAPYYVLMLPDRITGTGGISLFAITPTNPLGGSDLYWQSIKAIMQQ